MKLNKYPLLNEIIFLVVVSCVAGFAFNSLRTETLLLTKNWNEVKIEQVKAELPTIEILDAMGMLPKGEVCFVDAREPELFQEMHISGATNIYPYSPETEIAEKAEKLPKDKMIIIYCDSVSCDKSEKLAHKLMALGIKNVSVMPEGIEGWAMENGPMEATGL